MEYQLYLIIVGLVIGILVLINLILIPIGLALINSRLKRILKLLRKMYKGSKEEK